VLSRLDPELLRGDLFFEYGSQDRFSLFSTLMAPLVGAVGFDVAFFSYYVVALGLFVAGLQRLVLRLVPDSAGAIVGLVFAVMTPLSYGGHSVFHVLEPFTTPRLVASAFTLLGLAWMLDGRPFRSGAALLLGLAFHPLMAFPGVVIALGYAIWRTLGIRALGILVGAVAVATAAVLAIPPVGIKLFGLYDDAWKEGMRHFCIYQFPDAWRWGDWPLPVVALITGAAATWRLRENLPVARFVALTTGVGALGLVGAAIAMRLPYALPIMGQPYRAMWLVTVLAPPLLFAMLERVWRTTGPWRYAALLPLLAIAPVDAVPLIAAAVIVLFGVRIFGVSEGRRLTANLAGIVIGGIVLTGVWRVGGILMFCRHLLPQFDPMLFYELFAALAGPGILVGAALLVMRGVGRRLTWTSTAVALIGFAGLWQVAVFALPHVAALETAVDPHRPGIAFVADFLKEHPGSHVPQVYSNLRRVEIVWVDWRAQSYFDVNQSAGFLFTREATMEGLRRVPLAGPFEVDYVRRHHEVQGESVFKATQALGKFDAKTPLEPAHLYRLASDPRLDWIVLWDLDSKELLDLATAVGPRVAVFDAAELRRVDVSRGR
jgi:hypothetical protein